MQENDINIRFSSLKIRLTSLFELKLNVVGSLTVNDQYIHFRADLPQKENYQCGIIPWGLISSIHYDEL